MGRQRTVRMLGTRGVPSAHGGFETAVDHISRHLARNGWRVIVYCQVAGDPDLRGGGPIEGDMWQGVERVLVPALGDGPLGTARFDLRAARHAAQHTDLCVTFGYNTAMLNVLQRFRRQPLIFNMDGIEWKRERWGAGKRAVFYLNERIACLLADHLIADHPVIADHLRTRTSSAKITTIAYGAPQVRDAPTAPLLRHGLTPGTFSTVVCRPVAENNLREIVEAFSRRRRDHILVVLGDLRADEPYHAEVLAAASPEVLFPGAVYEPEEVGALRFHSLTYVHGHTVGGTNPSLVEALGAGNPVIAHDNPYNRWVAGEGQRYFRDADCLADQFDELLDDGPSLASMSQAARDRHAAEFTWPVIAGRYEQLLTRFTPGR